MPIDREFEDPIDPTELVESAEEQLEAHAYPAYDFADNQFRATRKFVCDWGDGQALIEAFLGGARKIGKYTHIKRPWLWASTDSNYPPAIAVAASVRPHSTETPDTAAIQPGSAEKVEVIVQFEYREYDVGQDVGDGSLFISEDWNPSAEFLTLPGGKLYWDSGHSEQLQTDETPGKIIRKGAWIITHHWLTSIPEGIDDWMGKVNPDNHTSPKYDKTFDVGTLQMASPVRERIMTATGEPAWNLTLVLAYQRDGWNKFHRAGFADPARIYALGLPAPFEIYASDQSFSEVVPT